MKADSAKFVPAANNRLPGKICSEPAIYIYIAKNVQSNHLPGKISGVLNLLCEISKFLRPLHFVPHVWHDVREIVLFNHKAYHKGTLAIFSLRAIVSLREKIAESLFITFFFNNTISRNNPLIESYYLLRYFINSQWQFSAPSSRKI